MTLAAVLLLVSGAPVMAQSPVPSSSAEGPGWPTGDDLRRDLQDIGFVFRVGHVSGDWLAWVPGAALSDAPALRLDGAGTREAMAAFDFALLAGDSPGPDADAALTAFMEVTARLPLVPTDVERARRFVVDDLLTEPPELLERCYASDWDRGFALATIDEEGAVARLRVASSAQAARTTSTEGVGPEAMEAGAVELPADLDLADCEALMPAEVIAELGDPSTERFTIAMTSAATPAFEPAQLTFEGVLVTLVLTFRNDSAVEQTLTFEAPLQATTGPVEPGGVRLIVVRQLPPGDYPFFSESDPDGLEGLIRIEAPSDG